MSLRIFILTALATVISASAATRTWRSVDGTKSFEAEFVSREGKTITVRQTTGKEISFDLSKLHADDQKWINLYHPTDTSKKSNLEETTGVFDQLEFGDTRAKVSEKLKQSQLVEGKAIEESELFGHGALNGVYKTRQKIGDLHASLHFTWSDDGKLTEISLQTDPLSAISYEDSLKLCWDDLILLLSDLHGAPVQSAPYPSRADVPQDAIIGSHIWKLEKGGTAMLGTAKISDKYIVVVRFSEKTVEEIQKSQKGAE